MKVWFATYEYKRMSKTAIGKTGQSVEREFKHTKHWANEDIYSFWTSVIITLNDICTIKIMKKNIVLRSWEENSM